MIKDKLIRIKRSRLNPEELLLIDIFNGMTVKEQTLYPNNICWEKDGNVLFLHSLIETYLIVNYNEIWRELEKYFRTYTQIQSFINKMVEENLNWIIDSSVYGQKYLKELDDKIDIPESHLFY